MNDTSLHPFFLRIAVLVLLSWSLPCHAGNAEWNVQALMQNLSSVQSSQGKFTESKFLSMLNRPIESSGTLSFHAPGHLEKHTLTPKVESLVLDEGVLTIDSRTRNIKRTLVLQEYPAVWAIVESIRSTLAGDLPTLQRFYKIRLEGDAAQWKMTLLPVERQTREVIREIRIAGKGSRILSIETFESNGDHALMKVAQDTP